MCSVRIHIISVALLVSDGMFALTPLAPCNCQHQIQFSNLACVTDSGTASSYFSTLL